VRRDVRSPEIHDPLDDFDMDDLFWLSTLIPGFAVLHLCFGHDIRRGVLGTLSWSFILTVGLVTPIVVVAYLFSFTIHTVVILYVAFTLLGIAAILISSRWQNIRRFISTIYKVELLIITFVTLSTAPKGSDLFYDHQMHVAKILYLRDIGFSLQDPYSPVEVVESKFHINMYHAIHAIGSYLSGKEPLELWSRSAWFFKLLALGGIEFLTFTIFHNRWSGTIAVLGALWVIASMGGITLPQQVGAYVVFPILLAHVIEFLERRKKRVIIKIVISSLALSVIHVAYWLLSVLVIIPTLLGWLVWNYRQVGFVSAGTSAIGGVLVGLPFLIITAMQPNYIMVQMGDLFLWETRTLHMLESWTLHFTSRADYIWMLSTGTMLALLLVLKKNRSKEIVLTSVFVSAFLYMYNPLFYEILMRLIPYWIINRMHRIGEVIAYSVTAGGLAWMLRRTLRTKTTRMLFAITVVFASLSVLKSTISLYYKSIDTGLILEQARELRDRLRPILQDRVLVLADPEMSLFLPAVQISSVMAPCLGNANPADKYVMQRYDAAREFFNPDTSIERRREITSMYHVDFVLIAKKWNTPQPLCSYRNDQESYYRGTGDLIIEGDWFELLKVRH
jgi:hypothetical protein